jgi:hypothetical protein
MLDRRTSYIESLRVRLDQISREIADLEARARYLRREKQMATLRQHRDAAFAKLKELEVSTDEALENLREGMESAWNALVEGVKNAKDSFDRSHSPTGDSTVSKRKDAAETRGDRP